MTTKILIVDDNPKNLYLLQVLLTSNGYEVLAAQNGSEALETTHRELPDVIVSDILMPVMDGFSFIRACKAAERTRGIPFIFYTATYTDPKDEELALSLGAERFIIKPAEPAQFLEIIKETIEKYAATKVATRERSIDEAKYFEEYSAALIRKLEDKIAELEEKNRIIEQDITKARKAEQEIRLSHRQLVMAYDATIEGWSRAMDLRDRETQGHTHRVTQLTIQLAKLLGINEEQLVHIQRGALLHDLGKLGIPDQILLKPGELTEEEWDIMRKHPQFAYDMLHQITYLFPAMEIPYCHHEKWDGSGYPRGLKGEEIPIAARIFAVIDVWDALSNDRPYRKAWPQDRIVDYIREQSGKHFDPQVAGVFLDNLGSF